MVIPNNHVIARGGFTFTGALGILKIFATSSCQTPAKTKKKFHHPNAVRLACIVPHYGKSGVQARSQKFEMRRLFGGLGAEPPAAGGQWELGVWRKSPQPPEARGSGGGAPSARKFCIFLQS